MASRTATAIGGILLSILISVGAWVFFDFPFLFLFVPFVPFLFRRERAKAPPMAHCPECGFSTRNPEFTYCPRDGSRLK